MYTLDVCTLYYFIIIAYDLWNFTMLIQCCHASWKTRKSQKILKTSVRIMRLRLKISLNFFLTAFKIQFFVRVFSNPTNFVYGQISILRKHSTQGGVWSYFELALSRLPVQIGLETLELSGNLIFKKEATLSENINRAIMVLYVKV